MDAYLEHRRFFKYKTKAHFRDWERDKKDLKERTVRLIEEEVDETKNRLMKDLELFRVESKKERKHQKLDEKRREYE
jgi:hypothetical protein